MNQITASNHASAVETQCSLLDRINKLPRNELLQILKETTTKCIDMPGLQYWNPSLNIVIEFLATLDVMTIIDSAVYKVELSRAKLDNCMKLSATKELKLKNKKVKKFDMAK